MCAADLDRVMLDFCDRLAGCRQIADLLPLLRRIGDALGLEHFDLAFRAPVFNAPSRFVVLTSFPGTLYRAYAAEALLADDPLVRRAAGTTRPFTWDMLDWDACEKARSLRRLQLDAGLEFGLSVPLYGPASRSGLFSLAGRRCPVDRERLGRLFDFVRLVAQHAFDRLVELAEIGTKVPDRHALTARELEFLRLSALGWPLKRINATMNIKQSTATYFTNRIVAKLGAKRLRMAVIQAQLNGLVDLVGFPEAIVETQGWYHESSLPAGADPAQSPPPVCTYLPGRTGRVRSAPRLSIPPAGHFPVLAPPECRAGARA